VADVVFAVGDMAGPADKNAGSVDTATLMTNLISTNPDALVFLLGDNAYNDGETDEYEEFFRPIWGVEAIASRVRPCPGNHDYHASNAAPYFAHFKETAGPVDRRGFYSFDLNSWHIVSLNTERDYKKGTAQLTWLETDLQNHADKPTLAFFHRPRFGSGGHGDSDNAEAFWDVLFRHRVEIVLNGHAHHYERFAPQTPKQHLDPAGIREFIIGTGGRGLVPPKPPGKRKPNSEVADGTTFGVLKLVLTPTSYEWEFVPTPGGGGFVDRSAAPHPTNH
jgi:calcineurin-like phosphoesterase family protein